MPTSGPTSVLSFSNIGIVAVAVIAGLVGLNYTYTSPKGVAEVCSLISSSISPASRVAYPGDPQHTRNIQHFTTTSSQPSACTVEPGTTEDVAKIIKLLGTYRTPFAVKGGGHGGINASSTLGVQIAMARFSEVTYEPESQVAVVGAGLVWDDVYEALAPHNVNVIGGRASGVGVAGFTLGGGYSFKTNQHGLTIDTVVGFELVTPDGAVVNVTQESDAELFFGLRGGQNNFGIVTRFTLKTFPQGLVWGGTITYLSPHLTEVVTAIAKYEEATTDPNAALVVVPAFVQGSTSITAIMFYDDSSPPPGIFDSFLEIPAFATDVKTREYLSLVQAYKFVASNRAVVHTVPLAEHTPKVFETILNETQFWGSTLEPKSGAMVAYALEPFLPDILSHNPYPPSAYPPDRTQRYLPLVIYVGWEDEKYDSVFEDAAKETARRIIEAAREEGQDLDQAPRYPNYAIYDTPLEQMYGGNLERLRKLKERVDPQGVMRLTGGFQY